MRKMTKSQKTLKCTDCDGVTALKVTTTGATKVKILEITHDGPVGFWPSLVTASGRPSDLEKGRRDDVKEGITVP